MNSVQSPLIISFISIFANIIAIVSFWGIITSVRSLKLEAFKEINERMRSIPTRELFSDFPCEIVIKKSPICKKPPKRHRAFNGEDLSFDVLEQEYPDIAKIVNELTDDQKKIARDCINGLNDIAALIEAKIVSYEDFLSTHHTSVLRIIHIIEPVRRFEESNRKNSIGGNYGQRLLRLYHQAYHYNMMHPKHRDKDIYVVLQGKKVAEPIVTCNANNKCKKILTSLSSALKYWEYKHFY